MTLVVYVAMQSHREVAALFSNLAPFFSNHAPFLEILNEILNFSPTRVGTSGIFVNSKISQRRICFNQWISGCMTQTLSCPDRDDMDDITRTVLDSDGLILRAIRVVLKKVWNNEDIVRNQIIKMLLDTWKPNQVKPDKVKPDRRWYRTYFRTNSSIEPSINSDSSRSNNSNSNKCCKQYTTIQSCIIYFIRNTIHFYSRTLSEMIEKRSDMVALVYYPYLYKRLKVSIRWILKLVHSTILQSSMNLVFPVAVQVWSVPI